MRTIVIIVGGLVLLGLLAALTNVWIGISRAGYSVAEEFPIFLAIFVIPAAVAAFVWWRYS